MVVREAFFLGVFLVVFKNWRFCIWAFFSRFPEIGVFFLAFFFEGFENWRFQFGRFFFGFQKLAFFSWRFFGRFFCSVFLRRFFGCFSFFKLRISKSGVFFGVFLGVFFGVFLGQF